MNTYSNDENKYLVAFGLRTYIGSVERGERNISLINIYKIASALSIPVTFLIVDKE